MVKKRGITKFLLSLMAVLLMSSLFVTMSPSQAQAFEGGSGSGATAGGGGGGNPTSGWMWRTATAMNQIGGMGFHGGEVAYANGGSNPTLHQDFCTHPDLVRIYWISGRFDNSAKWLASRNIAQPWTNPGGGDSIDQFAAGLNSPGTYLICVINSIERRATVEFQRQNLSSSTSRTAPYSWNTQINPEVVNAAGEDIIGVNNLNSQSSTATSTFGALYDSIATSGAGDYNSKVAAIDSAIAADANTLHASVNLNANNQAGLAEGGVLSVNEFTRNATLSLDQAWSETRSRTATCDYRRGTTTLANPPNCNYTAWSPWQEDVGSRNHSVTRNLGTQPNTGFWQILSVHCNPTELGSLLDSISGEQIVSQTAGVDENSTTVLYTRKFDSRAAALTAREILGNDLLSLSAPVARTGQLGFYDKECNLVCVASPSAASGASSANGALTNQSITTNQGGKSYLGGALFNSEVNSNYLEIFRDNNDRDVTLNTAYPRSTDPQFKYGGTYPNAATGTGTVTIPASAPVSTTITRWGSGTPATAADTGGQFSMVAVAPGGTRVQLFQPTATAPTTQLNWATNPYQSLNSTTLNGFYRSFIIKATWASEADLPQVLNVKWEYRPTVWTRFPSAVGFTNTAGNALQINSFGVLDQAVDGRCYAQYGTDSRDLNLGARVQASTGTGTTNTLDSALVEAANGDQSWEIQSNLVLKFVRAVSE